MVNPYSTGTRTLQEAPSFAWRTNGSTLNRERRENQFAMKRNRYAPLAGCSVLILIEASPLKAGLVDGSTILMCESSPKGDK